MINWMADICLTQIYPEWAFHLHIDVPALQVNTSFLSSYR